MTLQQQIIKEYLQEIIETNLIEVEENYLDENALKKIGRLSHGEYVALSIKDGILKQIVKLDGFVGSSTIDSESIIISFEQLEKKFYEQTEFQRQF